MTRRTFGVFIIAPALMLLLLATAVAAFGGGAAARPVAVAEASAGAAAQVPPQDQAPPPQSKDPVRVQGVWADVAPLPTISLPPTPGSYPARIKRAGATAYFPNGKIYLLGGRHGVDGEDFSLRSIFEYTPGNPGSWLQKAALLDGAQQGSIFSSNMAVATLTDTNGVRVYAIGGSSVDSQHSADVRIYNPVADTISVLTSDPWPAVPMRNPGGWAVHNNKLYIFGGFSAVANSGQGGVFTDTWRFDPMGAAGAKWTQLPTANLNLGRGYIAGAMLDGFIYAIGGDIWIPPGPPPGQGQLLPVNNVERMDPSAANPVWTNMAALPTTRGDMGAWAYDTGTGYEISGRIAVAGGVYPTPDNQGYLYNPGTNSWAVFPNMTHNSRNYGTAQLGGFLYAIGGYNFGNNLPDGANWVQRYDATQPTTPSPTVTGTPPTATRTHTVTVTNTPGGPSNTPTRTPTPVATVCSANYSFTTSTASIISGTVDTGNHCDDCGTSITLPFPVVFYGQTYNSANVISNGSLQFVSNNTAFGNVCPLPDPAMNYLVSPLWDDLRTDAGAGCAAFPGSNCGVFTSVTGSAPNRIFNIEWRAVYFASAATSVNFEIRFYEMSPTNRIDFVYGAGAGTATATIGLQKDTGSLFASYSCNGTGPASGVLVIWQQQPCVTGTPATATRTVTPGATTPTVTPCAGGTIVVQGAISANDPVQSGGRLFRDGIADTCAAPGTCGAPIAGSYRYDLYTYTNSSASSVCINVNVNTPCVGTNFIYSGAYLGSFNPANICMNWVADLGSSPNGTPLDYSFTVPAGATFVINVHEVTANAGCTAYTLTITGLPGGGCPSPTATVPVVASPTRTVTPPPGTTPSATATSPLPPSTPTRTPAVTVTSTPCPIQFTDVDQNNPFYIFIRCLACRQIVSGYADGTFRWGNNVTRGQLSKIISGAAGQGNNIPSSRQTFEDVPNSNVFWLFIERLAGVGAISGYNCGGPGEPCGPGNRPYFRWGNSATRGQISKITAVTAGWNGPIPTTQQSFEDVPSTNPFWLWIEELAGRQVISGYNCGGPGEPCGPGNRPYFRWGNNATRGQMSKIAAESFFPGCQTPAR